MSRPSPASPATTVSGSLLQLPGIRRLAGLATLGFTGFFLTLASLPSYAVRTGASSAEAGAVTAAMLASTVVMQAFVPVLDRRLGTSRLLSLGLIALGAPAPLYLVSDRLGWLIAISILRGLGFAVLTVLGALISIREAPTGRRGEAAGIYGLSIAGPNLLAVPAGTALTSYGHFGWVAVLAACPVLAVPLARGFHPPTGADTPQPPAASSATGSRKAARAAAAPSLVLLVVTLSGGGLVTFLPIARPQGSLASITLLLFGLTGALTRWQAGTHGDRMGPRLLLPAGLVAGVTGMTLVAVSLIGDHAGQGWSTLLLIGAALFGAGYGATQNLTQIVAFARAGAGNMIAASAIWNAAFDTGTAIGAYGVGLVAATALGLPGTYLVCAALIGLAVPVAIMTTPRRPSPPRSVL